VLFFLVIVAVQLIQSRSVQFTPLLPRLVLSGAALAIGLILPTLAFPFWTGAAKPHSYAGSFLTYRAFADFGRGTNGPASRSLAEMLQLPPDEPLPFWIALGETYSQLGSRKSDKLLTAAGLEAAAKNASALLTNTLQSVQSILTGPFSISAEVLGWKMKLTETRYVLAGLDHYRRGSSALFGNDATTSTSDITEIALPFVIWLRSFLPSVQIILILPGSLVLVGPALALVLWVAPHQSDAAALIPPAIYGIAVMFLGAAAIGDEPRYVAPMLCFDLIICVLALALIGQELAARLSQRCHQTSPLH
jgi:hypothetical protein